MIAGCILDKVFYVSGLFGASFFDSEFNVLLKNCSMLVAPLGPGVGYNKSFTTKKVIVMFQK